MGIFGNPKPPCQRSYPQLVFCAMSNDDPFNNPTDDEDLPSHDSEGRLSLVAQTMFEEDRAVLFVDLLGFSRLTLKWPVVKDQFWLLDRPNKQDFLRVRLESTGNNRLIETYMHFNMALDSAIEHALLQDTQVTAIAFSDSAFLATDRVYDAMDIAEDIWHQLLKEHIPVRCGIAYGSFLVMRFRSDISLRAETHAAQFAGKGVVWAHAACELSGLKGFRIFLHPSAAKQIGDPNVGRSEFGLVKSTLTLLENERSEHVAKEMMLLHKRNTRLKDIMDRELWRDIQTMHQAAILEEAPEGALAHHAATFDAINRMREQFGRPPLHPAEQFPLEPRPVWEPQRSKKESST
jgi:hypothetical protein